MLYHALATVYERRRDFVNVLRILQEGVQR